MAIVQLVGAVGPDQHHAAVGEISHQEPEHVAGRWIGPMQVLECDDGDRIRGDALDQPEHLEVEGGLARRGGRFGRSVPSARLEVGDQLQDGGSCRPDDAVEVIRAQGLQPRTKCRDEWVVRRCSISEVDTCTPEETRPADSASARSSASNRVLPTPASPPTMTVPTDPDLAPSSRPAAVGTHRRVRRIRDWRSVRSSGDYRPCGRHLTGKMGRPKELPARN